MKAVKYLGYSARFPFPQRAHVNCSPTEEPARAGLAKAGLARLGREGAAGALPREHPAWFRWPGGAV